MGLFRKSDREALGAASAAFSLIALLMAFSTLIVVIRDDDSGGSGGGPVAPGEVTVSLTEFAIEPATLEVDEGAKLSVVNNGLVAHNLAVTDTDKLTKDLNNGDTATLDLAGLAPGEYEMYCAIPGHKEAGMLGTLAVGVEPSAGSKESGSSGATAEELLASNEADDKLQAEPVLAYAGQLTKIVEQYVADGTIDPSLYEPNTEFPLYTDDPANNPLLGPPTLPFTMDGDTKVFELTSSVIEWQTDPKTTVSAWAYNGTVPAPTMKLEPGDKVRVVYKNELPQSSAVHWHGLSTIPIGMDGVPFVTQDPVKPGEEFIYEFTAPTDPAVAMYHSHHHGEHQIPDGLFGAILVGDFTDTIQAVTGKPAADVRIPMVLNDAGSIGLSLNAKSFPATAPIVAKVGQWVQLEYFNEGLSIHPMHLHGLPQIVIAKDGYPESSPYKADTLNVAPGERYTVLIQATEQFLDNAKNTAFAPLGVWAFHCHILTHAERHDGMFGMVTTFIVIP